MCIRDIEPIRYSAYVDECRCTISETKEFSTDIYAVHLTRLHGLAERIKRTLNFEGCLTTPAFTAAPIGVFATSLELELLQLKGSSSDEAQQNGFLLIHYYIIEIYLYETALDENVDPMRYGTYPIARLNMLYACLNSTKLCFDAIYSVPLSNLFDLPHPVWTLLGHAIVVLSKLSLCQTEGWDNEYVRSVLDVSEGMERLARRFEEAKALAETASRLTGHKPSPRDVLHLFLKLPKRCAK